MSALSAATMTAAAEVEAKLRAVWLAAQTCAIIWLTFAQLTAAAAAVEITATVEVEGGEATNSSSDHGDLQVLDAVCKLFVLVHGHCPILTTGGSNDSTAVFLFPFWLPLLEQQ